MTDHQRVLNFILKEPWAIRQDALESIIEIAHHQGDIQAVEAKLGKPLQNTHTVTTRGSVAIVPIIGPIFRYANLFTKVSGATSLELLATDFNSALENPNVKSIVLEIDSPGGMAAGISEFAGMVRASSKKVVAYTSNTAGSAAYWIAAAAHEVVISDTSQVGSIGVITGYSDDKEDGSVRFVSSQSPRKRLDMDKEDDRAAMQQTIDDVAEVFISKVANYRGVSRETALSSFGQGWVLVGERAVTAGMADRLGSLEQVIKSLNNGSTTNAAPRQPHHSNFKTTQERIHMTFEEQIQRNWSSDAELRAEFDDDFEAYSAYEQAMKTGAVKVLGGPGGANNTTHAEAPAEAQDQAAMAKWESDKELQAEFGGDFQSFLAYHQATKAGLVRTTNKTVVG